MSTDDNFSVKSLDPSTWPAFAALIEANDGVWGGCWCMSFHSEGNGKNTTPELNRERKQQRVLSGNAHAALVFDEEQCVGWAQFGAPAEVSNIKNRATYERELISLPDWRIGCVFASKGHRRRGVSVAAVAGAVDLIAASGGGLVEGYPEDGSAAASFVFNGTLDIYKDLGFAVDRQIGKRRWVVQKWVEPL